MYLRALEALTPADLDRRLQGGARLVFFEYCISFVFVTLRRPSAVMLLGPGERGLVRGLPYTLISLMLGWWGLPWGLVYTPRAVFTNLCGGRDVTAEVYAFLQTTADGTL
jgi:hypothetical protein